MKAIQTFFVHEENSEFTADSIRKGFTHFLSLYELESVDADVALHNIVAHYDNKSKGCSRYDDFEAIDYNKTTNSEFIDGALEPIKGVMGILSSMNMDKTLEGNPYHRQSYEVLHDTCASVLKNFEELKIQIDYMEDNLRDKPKNK